MPSAQGPRVDAFYHSDRWRKARAYVIRQRHGVCEECGRRGTEVHHIVALTEANVDGPLATDPSNLEVLCKSCHDAKRGEGTIGRCRFDENGDVTAISPSTPPGGVPKK